MATTMPPGDDPLSIPKTTHLITPSLTPVREEFGHESPFYDSPYQVVNRDHAHQDSNSHETGSSHADGGRKRSISVPIAASDHAQSSAHSTSSRRLTTETSSPTSSHQQVLKLSSSQIKELTSAPDSLPVRPASSSLNAAPLDHSTNVDCKGLNLHSSAQANLTEQNHINGLTSNALEAVSGDSPRRRLSNPVSLTGLDTNALPSKERPTIFEERPSTPENFILHTANGQDKRRPSESKDERPPSPMPEALPLPPLSMPTYLHLELSSERPSPLYIYQSPTSAIQYESTSAKFERLLNFLLLPPQLERVLLFGALACLDAWLYNFTVLPLRFLRALWILIEWAALNVSNEIRYLTSFVWAGTGRLWYRRRESIKFDPATSSRRPSELESDSGISKRPTAASEDTKDLRNRARRASHQPQKPNDTSNRLHHPDAGKHRRTRSIPSLLQPNHKADLLHGALIVVSCMLLLRFDASRMYHSIRGQSAIKLYVIYNVLEVCDRLFSALGQDIIECLFSSDTLTRYPNGRSKVIRPFWMFILALIYTVAHATAFFYQVITLNVAINSYSNALLTLLMSNQFVEIKGTVFKKFEKENLFQLTCADIVERFQLWLMLLVIALRNIVEMGGLSVTNSKSGLAGLVSNEGGLGDGLSGNSTNFTMSSMPFNLPNAFTIIPNLFPAQVLVPFLVVLASETLVDSLKHAYIAKFNAVSPYIYGRFYDVLAKDYYSTAFHPQQERGMVRRLGLPSIPLACLFIRALLQTYHMFLATNISSSTLSTATGLSELGSENSSKPGGIFDHFFLRALGRSSFGGGSETPVSTNWWWNWSLDDAIALTTMLVFFLVLYLLLLAFKLVLGMVLLRVARNRYRHMKQRELRQQQERERGRSLTQDRGGEYSVPSKRLGPWGTVEIGDDRRRIIYDGDPEGLKNAKDREARARDKERKKLESFTKGQSDGLDKVDRYRMVAKRIW